MQLITIGNRIFNIEALTHGSYEPACTEVFSSDPTCTLSFGCDDILIFYGEEALQAWEMVEAQSINLTKLNKARGAVAA